MRSTRYIACLLIGLTVGIAVGQEIPTLEDVQSFVEKARNHPISEIRCIYLQSALEGKIRTAIRKGDRPELDAVLDLMDAYKPKKGVPYPPFLNVNDLRIGEIGRLPAPLVVLQVVDDQNVLAQMQEYVLTDGSLAYRPLNLCLSKRNAVWVKGLSTTALADGSDWLTADVFVVSGNHQYLHFRQRSVACHSTTRTAGACLRS